MDKKRRNVLRSVALAPLLASTPSLFASSDNKTSSLPSTRLQYSVNAFTFNSQLKSGDMTFLDMMQFAANLGLNAVDLTGYYFSGYPDIPKNETLFQLKKKALQLGLNISWTGVRNNFVKPDKASRSADIKMIQNWLQVSSKLGAGVMRIFAGKGKYDGYSKEAVKDWMVNDFKTCANYAEETGVIAALQHHNDFLYTADEVIEILKRVDSEWFGLILDIGSLRQGDPYEEIKKLAPYATYWFIKELVYVNGVPEPVNMKKIAKILKEQNYTGYISFESLTDGDPKEIVTQMYQDFKLAYSKL